MKIIPLAIFVSLLAALATALTWLENRDRTSGFTHALDQIQVLSPQDLAAASGITVESPTEQTELALVDGAWINLSHFALPADTALLRRTLTEMGNAKVLRHITERPERAAELGIGDHVITLKNAKGQTLATLEWGRMAEAGGRFIRRPPSAQVLLVDSSPQLNADPITWLRKNPVSIPLDGLKAISITFSDQDEAVHFDFDPEANAFKAATPLAKGQQLNQSRFRFAVEKWLEPQIARAHSRDEDAVLAARTYAQTAALAFEDGRQFSFHYGRVPPKTIYPEPEDPQPEAPEALESESADSRAPASPFLDEFKPFGDVEVAAPQTPQPEPIILPAGTPYLWIDGLGSPYHSIAFALTTLNFDQYPRELSSLLMAAPKVKPELGPFEHLLDYPDGN